MGGDRDIAKIAALTVAAGRALHVGARGRVRRSVFDIGRQVDMLVTTVEEKRAQLARGAATFEPRRDDGPAQGASEFGQEPAARGPSAAYSAAAHQHRCIGSA